MRKISVIVLLMAMVIACSKKTSPSSSTPGETKSAKAVSFNTDVVTLIETKCTPCHVPSKGGFKTDLDNYDAAKRYIDDIITRIQLPSSDPKYMPFKHQALRSDEIAVFKDWKTGGFAR